MHDSRMTCPAPCVYHWGNKKKKERESKGLSNTSQQGPEGQNTILVSFM